MVLPSTATKMTVVGLRVVMMSVQVEMVIGDDDGDVDDHDQDDGPKDLRKPRCLMMMTMTWRP